MTAFGRGQSHLPEGGWVVEIRTVNSRFLDLNARLPGGLAVLEERIKKYLEPRLSRGRVSLSVKSLGAAAMAPRLVVNRALVAEYRRAVEELKAILGSGEEPGLVTYLQNRDLMQVEEADPDYDLVWTQLLPALDAALAEAEAMRRREGEALSRDLEARLARIGELFTQAAAASPQIVENYRQRLKDRIAQLMAVPEPDPERLAYEVAILADKCDITEEIVRAKSHLKQFAAFLRLDQPWGASWISWSRS